MVDDGLLKILEDIRSSQHKQEIILEQIKGDNKLQSQALQYHIELLKEFKTKTDDAIQALEERIGRLEKWQARIAGIAAIISAIAVLLFTNIKEALFTK